MGREPTLRPFQQEDVYFGQTVAVAGLDAWTRSRRHPDARRGCTDRSRVTGLDGHSLLVTDFKLLIEPPAGAQQSQSVASHGNAKAVSEDQGD